MKNKRLLTLLSSICLILVLAVLPFMAACAKPAPAPAPAPEEVHIMVGGSGPGGAFYPLACGVMTVINEHVPGVMATAIGSGATENFRMVLRGEMFMCLWSNSGAADVYSGPTELIPEAHPDLRWMFPTHGTWSFLITLDPKVKSVRDLKGKRVAIGGPGTTDPIYGESFLSAAGQLEKDVDYKAILLDGFEAVEAMMDGRVDAVYTSGGAMTSAVAEVDAVKDVNFIRYTDEELDDIIAALEERGFKDIRGMVSKDIYKGLEDDYETLVHLCGFFALESADEEIVYKITKAVWENTDILALVHSAGAEMDLENVKKGMGLPCHPGALRYYKEIGVLTEDPFKG